MEDRPWDYTQRHQHPNRPSLRPLSRSREQVHAARVSRATIPVRRAYSAIYEFRLNPDDLRISDPRHSRPKVRAAFPCESLNLISLAHDAFTHIKQGLEEWSKITGSQTAAILDVFPILRRLPDAFFPLRKFARKLHERECEFYGGYYMAAKKRLEEGKSKVSTPRHQLTMLCSLVSFHPLPIALYLLRHYSSSKGT